MAVVSAAVLCLATARAEAQSTSVVEIGAGGGYMVPKGLDFPALIVAGSYWLVPRLGIAASFDITPGEIKSTTLGPQTVGIANLVAVRNRTHQRITVRTRVPLSPRSSLSLGAGLFAASSRVSYARLVTPTEVFRYELGRDFSGFSFEALGDVALKGVVAIQFGLVLDVSERSYPMPFALLKVGL
mgnify:CR=1 FL=1